MEASETLTTAATLAQIARDESPEAWAILIERHAGPVAAIATAILGRTDLAQDAMQETFVHLRRSAHRFRPSGDNPEAQAVAWIRRIAANCALMLLRQERRRLGRERLWSQENAPVAAETAADLEPDREAVHLALAEITEQHRQPLVLRFLADQDYPTVAQALGCSVQVARVRVDRALDQLRRRLASRGIGAGSASLGSCLTVSFAATAEPALPASASALLTGTAQPLLPTHLVVGGLSIMKTVLVSAGIISVITVTLGFSLDATPAPAPTPGIAAVPPITSPSATPPADGTPVFAEQAWDQGAILLALARRLVVQHGRSLASMSDEQARKLTVAERRDWSAIAVAWDTGNWKETVPQVEAFMKAYPKSPILAHALTLRARALNQDKWDQEIRDYFPQAQPWTFAAMGRQIERSDRPHDFLLRIDAKIPQAGIVQDKPWPILAWTANDRLPPISSDSAKDADITETIADLTIAGALSLGLAMQDLEHTIPLPAEARSPRAVLTALTLAGERDMSIGIARNLLKNRPKNNFPKSDTLENLIKSTSIPADGELARLLPQWARAYAGEGKRSAEQDPTRSEIAYRIAGRSYRVAARILTAEASDERRFLGKRLQVLGGTMLMRSQDQSLAADMLSLLFEKPDRSSLQDTELWAEAGFWLGEAQARQGKKTDALVTWKRLTWEAPSSSWAHQARGRMAAARDDANVMEKPAQAPQPTTIDREF